MACRNFLFACLLAIAGPALAQKDRGGGEDRWNAVGPAWYQTECGHVGFAVTHGWPYQNWRKPCSVPIRVCEYKSITINYPAEPDVPCEKMVNPATAGELQRTYIKRWD
jgi:hypothetical protein